MFRRHHWLSTGLGVAITLVSLRAQTTPAPDSLPPPAAKKGQSSADSAQTSPPAVTPGDLDALYDFGKQLFDDYAPAEVKEQYDFVSQEQWTTFTGRLQKSFAAGSVEDLATLEPDARRTLAALRTMPQFSEYADWLADRLDLIETARIATFAPPQLSVTRPPVVTLPPPTNKSDEPPPVVAFKPVPRPTIPFYDIWLKRLQDRPKPARADELMPVLKLIFAAEGLPTELVWLAEVESSLNPSARSPAGARGLFQLMPATARAFGLSTFPFDERTQPGKNARAAAQLLRVLHARFKSWPLALAAFNAGEGRIAIAQKKSPGDTFADIAELLPAETRMYVPKVLATLAVREKINPEKLPAPGATGSGRLAPVPAQPAAAIVAAP